MMVVRHSQFGKNYKKRILPYSHLDKKFEERLRLFIKDPLSPELKEHKLVGSLMGFRAFSVTGDIRVIYRIIEGNIELYDIGTHNQVY